MFKVKDRQITSVEPFLYKPETASETYEAGEALTGEANVTKCGATVKPDYICVGAAKDGVVPVIPVLATTCFCAPYTAKPTVGTKVTLHTDGLQVTATTTSGVFTVTEVDEDKGVACGYFK